MIKELTGEQNPEKTLKVYNGRSFTDTSIVAILSEISE